MHSLENNEQLGRCLPRHASGVELTFHRVALFSGERIEPHVDCPFYTMAIVEHIYRYKCVHLQVEMCLTSKLLKTFSGEELPHLSNKTFFHNVIGKIEEEYRRHFL